jgi:hypothetical protein
MFGPFFFSASNVPSVPPAAPPDPRVGDVWEYLLAAIPNTPKGTRIQIAYIDNYGLISATDVDNPSHVRMWADLNSMKSAWKLVTTKSGAKEDPDASRFPHVCPRCKKPAYVGFGPSNVDCSSPLCSTTSRTMKLQTTHQIGITNS